MANFELAVAAGGIAASTAIIGTRKTMEREMPEENDDFMPAADYGRSLTGFGVNILVPDVGRTLSFLTEVLGIEVVHANRDFAVLTHGGQQWMLHGDHTYHSHPLLALTGDGALRGIGVELRLYGIDPDAAEAKARAAGYEVLQEAKNKPHGLRESYLLDGDGFLWVPGMPISDGDLPG
jgi:catechol 2,3-dioxygenase-like lactoylglutathione lyase family enzyme